jgi:hypothetical protein
VDLVDLLRVHCAWGGPPGAAPADREHQKVISAWAIHYSRRRQFAAEARARRGARRSASAGPAGFGRSYGSGSVREPASSAEAEAEKIVKLLQARATAARAEAVWADSTVEIAGPAAAPGLAGPAAAPGPASATAPASAADTTDPVAAPASAATTTLAVTGWTEPLTSTWSRRALAALLIPALILLIVVLV